MNKALVILVTVLSWKHAIGGITPSFLDKCRVIWVLLCHMCRHQVVEVVTICPWSLFWLLNAWSNLDEIQGLVFFWESWINEFDLKMHSYTWKDTSWVVLFCIWQNWEYIILFCLYYTVNWKNIYQSLLLSILEIENRKHVQLGRTCFFVRHTHAHLCEYSFTFFFFFCKIDLHHCKNCVVWSYTETFCIFRIGWILILGLQRVLILLLYHLSSLLKWLNILKATLLRGLVMGKLIYLHIVFSTQLFWCHQENCPNPSTLPFSLLLSFSPQFWLKMHYSLLALSY